MSKWYILSVDNKPVAVSITEAVQWMEDNPERKAVKQDHIDDKFVSTVFLGLDHSWNNKELILWETMIFGGEHDQYQERYSSYEDALEGHQKAINLIKQKSNESLSKQFEDIINNTNDVLYKEEIYINSKHEYDYHKVKTTNHDTVHTLYYSDNDEWSDDLKKQVAMQLVDTGNGIQIIGACVKKEIEYLEAEHLHILLRLASVHSVYQIAEPKSKKDF